MKLYSDTESRYTMTDYGLTHSQLLIRSKKNKARDFNIDIIFKGVSAMVFPVDINGIEIYAANKDHIAPIPQAYGFKNNKNYEIFEIKDAEGATFYLNAMSFGVYRNKLDIVDSSIGRYDWGGLGERILWFSR